MRIKLTLLLTFLSLSVSAQRENLFTIDAQVRTRGEYDNGAHHLRNEGVEPVLFVGNRTRLTLGYQRKNLELRASGQYTGIWGDESQQKSSRHLSLNEAWGKLNFQPGIFVQLGRMPLAYDDERILGASDWSLTGYWHDALRVGFENQTHQAHLFATYLQDNDNTRGGYYTQPMPYKQMQGLWYHLQLLPEMPLGISVTLLNTGTESGTQKSGKTRWLQTMGGHLTFQPYHFNVAASFYYQRGKDATSDRVGAFMASGRLGYEFPDIISLRAGFDYFSGNDGLNANQHAFNPLFGTGHNFFGAMDYFTGRINFGLQDITAGLTAHLTKDITLDADYHYLSMAEIVYGFDIDRPIGHEVDIKCDARIFKDVTLQAGYSMMFGTPTLDVIQSGDHTRWHDWAWISLNINPRLFLTKW